jgi:hypothetical protein
MATKKKLEIQTEDLTTKSEDTSDNLETFPVIIDTDSMDDLPKLESIKTADKPAKAEPALTEPEVLPALTENEVQTASSQTTDKIGQIVSQRSGRVAKYYKRLRSNH